MSQQSTARVLNETNHSTRGGGRRRVRLLLVLFVMFLLTWIVGVGVNLFGWGLQPMSWLKIVGGAGMQWGLYVATQLLLADLNLVGDKRG